MALVSQQRGGWRTNGSPKGWVGHFSFVVWLMAAPAQKKQGCRPGAFHLIYGSVLMGGKRREERRTDGGGEGCGETERERERGLSVFFKRKALPSDTCHRVGMNPLSVWQEVGASRQELKGRVYANSSSQRKWVPSVSAWGAK